MKKNFYLSQALTNLTKKKLDETLIPVELHVRDDVQEEAFSAGRNLTKMLLISPAPFRINKTPIRQLGSATLKTMKRKLLQVLENGISF